jgi:hypothetical protein
MRDCDRNFSRRLTVVAGRRDHAPNSGKCRMSPWSRLLGEDAGPAAGGVERGKTRANFLTIDKIAKNE